MKGRVSGSVFHDVPRMIRGAKLLTPYEAHTLPKDLFVADLFSCPFKWLPPYSVWQWYNFSIHAQFAALEIETDWSLIVCARGGLPFFRGENWCCHLGNIVIVQMGLMAHSRAQDFRRNACVSVTCERRRRLCLCVAGAFISNVWVAKTVKQHFDDFKTFCWTTHGSFVECLNTIVTSLETFHIWPYAQSWDSVLVH